MSNQRTLNSRESNFIELKVYKSAKLISALEVIQKN